MNENGVSRSATRTLHVAMIFEGDADDPRSMSGMPYHMAGGLRNAGARVTPITITPRWTGQAATKAGGIRRYLPAPVSRQATAAVRQGRDLLRRLQYQKTRDDMMAHAAAQSRVVGERLRDLYASDPPDVVFSCSLSRTLYKLETQIPIIFYNDTTTRIVLDTYPLYMRAPRGYREACDLMEIDAFKRTTALVFATEEARESAVDYHGYDRDRIYLAPMGANVLPDESETVRAPAEPPTRNDLRLCVIAADPERKRVDLCIAVTEALVRRGIKARLSYIGPHTKTAARSACTDSIGRLSLSDPEDRRRHRQVLAESHIQLLPSLGEAFGIAPCESAHYARPSIVTDVGGLPTVVQHNQTGFVVPLDAGPGVYVGYIERLLDDPDLYRRLSIGALQRARSTLNWDAWGRTLVSIMREVVGVPGTALANESDTHAKAVDAAFATGSGEH